MKYYFIWILIFFSHLKRSHGILNSPTNIVDEQDWGFGQQPEYADPCSAPRALGSGRTGVKSWPGHFFINDPRHDVELL